MTLVTVAGFGIACTSGDNSPRSVESLDSGDNPTATLTVAADSANEHDQHESSPTSIPQAREDAAATATRPDTDLERATEVTGTPTPESVAADSPQPQLTPAAVGALVAVSLVSQVGVLLDEFPVDLRENIASILLQQGDQEWVNRAIRQVRLTRLRLTFRDFVYDKLKGQLPLPPEEHWTIELAPSGASRSVIQDHDLVTITYGFSTVILTDAISVAQAEPALGEVGGIWEEPFVFPADPDQLAQRTGNACINEGGFPPNSFDSENAWHFYDFACTADSGGALGCHRLLLPSLSCRQALAAAVGEVETVLRFERLAWDRALAERVRSGPLSSEGAPDLQVVEEDLGNNRVVYKYFEADDCAFEEGAIGGTGWRRLLQFDATVHNIGNEPLHIGPAVTEDIANHVFKYSLCHNHFHYTNYGDFFLLAPEEVTGSKQAFCVQSTRRLSNNELSPLVHGYSCRFQGIQAGWADEYIAGLDAQWIDITDVEIPADGLTVQLGFRSNGDRFLCEGKPILNDQGEPLWEPSGLRTEHGESINRPRCDFPGGWDANNLAVVEVFLAANGSFVTSPCSAYQVGPRRNCGFTALDLPEVDPVCRPGERVTLELPQVELEGDRIVRVCEWSTRLGTGMACAYEDSLANAVQDSQRTELSFLCPRVRDAAGDDPSGRFSLYTAPLLPVDADVDTTGPGSAMP